MTITAQTSKTGPYSGNGTTTVFSYTFEVQDEAHLVIDILEADGATNTRAILNTDYTVTGVGASGGGTVVMLSAPAIGQQLTISRAVPLDQEVDLENRRSVAPEVLEDAFDKLTQISQDQQQQLDRTIKVDLFETTDLNQLVLNINSVAENGLVSRYFGAYATAPTVRTDGTTLQVGDLYFNTVYQGMQVFSGSGWVDYQAGAKIAQALAEDAQAAAEAAEAGAQTAQTAAETARDAAFVNADVYADTTAGLAGTTLGDQFQVVSGDEIIRYSHDSGPTATEVARYFSASFETYHKLLRRSALDKADGFTWSLADWYLDNPTRISTVPWYDATDKSLLFQDVAGSTPVTAPGDPVRLIKSRNGYADHDLIINDTLLPAVYRERGGVGCVDLDSQAGFKSRANVVLTMPLFLATAMAWRSRNEATFGVVISSVGYISHASPQTTQNRPILITNGSAIGEQGYNPAIGEFGTAPNDAPLVMHSQCTAGLNDIEVNDIGGVTDANTWTGTGTSSSAWVTVGMASNTAEADADVDFYGGLIFYGVIEAEDRANIVAYLQRKCERRSQTTDRNILIVGDSTGDGNLAYTGAGGIAPSGGDWPYRLLKQLATDNSGYFVSHRNYEDQLGYNAEEHLQDGTAGAIIGWNASIAGSQPGQHLGENFIKSISGIPLCDTVIVNHGYNIGASGTSTAAYAAAYMSLIEEVKRHHPKAHFFLTRQPDTESGASYTAGMIAAVDTLATLYGADKFDIYDEFDSYAGPDDLWSDGLHYTEEGAALAAVRAIADYNAALPIEEQGPGYIDRKATGLLSNEKFWEWTAGAPDNWSATGSGTVSEVAVVDDESGPSAVAIADTSSTSTYISQTVDATGLQGQTVTLGVRTRFVPDAAGNSFSRIEFITNGTGGGSTYSGMNAKWSGGWLWHFSQCIVPADATTLEVRLYGRLSGSYDLTVEYSHACLIASSQPRTSG